jgi:hypothetical protein
MTRKANVETGLRDPLEIWGIQCVREPRAESFDPVRRTPGNLGEYYVIFDCLP